MSFNLATGPGERCTLYSSSEYQQRFPSGAPTESFGRKTINAISPFALALDDAQLARLRDFLRRCVHYPLDATADSLIRALKRAIDRRDVFAVAEVCRVSSGGNRSGEEPRPRAITFSPSQLFRGAAKSASVARAFRPSARALPRLPADDGIAIWFAKPGDVLPDGTIATPLATPLADARPFEYTPDAVSDDLQDLAARGVSERDEADCFAQYEFDLDQCNFVRAMTQDPRAYAMCKQTAFKNYQQCRGL